MTIIQMKMLLLPLEVLYFKLLEIEKESIVLEIFQLL